MEKRLNLNNFQERQLPDTWRDKVAKIIVIDGADGVGKETQTKLIKERLEGMGYNVLALSFPVYKSPSSYLIREYLAGRFVFNTKQALRAAFAIDRAVTMNEVNIKTFITDSNTKNIVLCDRYTSSLLLYSTIEDDQYNFLLNTRAIMESEKLMDVPEADLNILLNLDLSYAKKVFEEREEDGTGTDILERDTNCQVLVRKNIKRLSEAYPVRFKMVLCNDKERRFTPEEVSDTIMNIITKYMEV